MAMDASSVAIAAEFNTTPAIEFPHKRVRTPTVLQLEAAECGAAALGSILAYYGRYVPLERLRVACGISRDGSKADNILKGAREYGLTAKACKRELGELAGLRLPYIVFWNFNYFLVVEGFGRDKVYLNDPSRGPREVSYREFDLSFTGLVLLLERGPEFTKGGEKPSTLRSLKARLPGSWLALVPLILATLGLALPNLISPVFSRIYVDDFLIGGKEAWLKPLLLVMVAVCVVKCLATYLQQSSLLRLEI